MEKVSPFADLINFNSAAGMKNHAAMGMRSRGMAVLSIGFDMGRFGPETAMGTAHRQTWGVPWRNHSPRRRGVAWVL